MARYEYPEYIVVVEWVQSLQRHPTVNGFRFRSNALDYLYRMRNELDINRVSLYIMLPDGATQLMVAGFTRPGSKAS